ncbi:hypothetical protein RHMOL_Rhmol07G0108300 [Rhododendron molle]|uniref:Uncharacterized protein n=1 Tax=Rhododendron molle TaxID=49168 RepID=A0ACC0MZI7_RHOML|nr:hypothetical protein RHMOL_Rhmol07G0108300 [Rhododendron molle]
MATYLFGVRLDDPPLLRNPNLLQSNAMDNDNNKHRDVRIPLHFLDSLSRFDQEAVYAQHQEPQPLPFLDILSRFNQEAVYARHQEPQEKKGIARRPGPPLVLSLVLMTPGSYDWNIKKTLKSSDVNDLCRLMLKKTAVHEHILSKWGAAQRTAVMETEHGMRVSVLDINTDTVHELVFKKWRSSGSFVFTNNWVTQFVKRRGLKT